MLSILTITLGLVSRCSDIEQVYKDSACCGGNGEAFCAASDTLDFGKITAELAEIKAKLASLGPSMPPSPPVSYDYLDQWCFPDAPPEMSELGKWPPSAEKSAYVDANGYPSFGDIARGTYPHTAGYPPYLGLCTSARQAMDSITAQCPSLGTTGTADFYQTFIAATSQQSSYGALSAECQSGAKLILLFSIILQFEHKFATAETDVGRAYLDSLLVTDELVGFPGQMSVASLNSYGAIATSMLPALDEAARSRLEVSVLTYTGHRDIAITAAPLTSGTTIDANERVALEPYGTKLYPANYAICAASQRMFDYMIQNPTDFYPELGDGYGTGYNYMFRCSARGGIVLKAQSDILGYERALMNAGNATDGLCPSVETVRAIADRASRFLQLSNEKYIYKSCLVMDCTAGAGPSNAETFWLMGDDIEYMRTEWITFLHVHLAAIQGYCGIDYVVSDPWGVTDVEFSIADMEELRKIQGAAYPTSEPEGYVSPYSEKCPTHGYTPAAPHETPCTVENYPGGTNLPQVAWADFRFAEENVCQDDPVNRYAFHNPPGLSVPVPYETLFNMWKSALPDIDDCFFCNVGKPSLQPAAVNAAAGGANYIVPGWVTEFSWKDIYPKTCSEKCADYTHPACAA